MKSSRSRSSSGSMVGVCILLMTAIVVLAMYSMCGSKPKPVQELFIGATRAPYVFTVPMGPDKNNIPNAHENPRLTLFVTKDGSGDRLRYITTKNGKDLVQEDHFKMLPIVPHGFEPRATVFNMSTDREDSVFNHSIIHVSGQMFNEMNLSGPMGKWYGAISLDQIFPTKTPNASRTKP